MKSQNIVFLELLEKSQESEGNSKERVLELEEMLHSKEKDCKKEVTYEEEEYIEKQERH